MHDLVIYGAGGLGREVAEIVRGINDRQRFWNFLGFIDDVQPEGSAVSDKKILGGASFIEKRENPLDVVLAIADPENKKAVYERLKKFPWVHFPNVIGRNSEIAFSAKLAEGIVISYMCSVSVDVELGACVFINAGSHVGHDTIVGDFCTIMSNVNVSGSISIGECTMIGAGVSILQGRKIGSHVTLGMGSVILRDVPDRCTMLGNPAKKF